MAVPTHDYDRLETEFLREDVSIRALCRRHGIKSYSAVAEYARKHGWYDAKRRIAQRSADRTIEKVAERISEVDADAITQFRDDVLTVARALVYRVAENLRDPEYRVRLDDFVKVVQLALLVTGQPTERTEERRLDLRASVEGLSPEVLRRLVDATRPAFAEPAGAAASTGAGPTRTN